MLSDAADLAGLGATKGGLCVSWLAWLRSLSARRLTAELTSRCACEGWCVMFWRKRSDERSPRRQKGGDRGLGGSPSRTFSTTAHSIACHRCTEEPAESPLEAERAATILLSTFAKSVSRPSARQRSLAVPSGLFCSRCAQHSGSDVQKPCKEAKLRKLKPSCPLKAFRRLSCSSMLRCSPPHGSAITHGRDVPRKNVGEASWAEKWARRGGRVWDTT